MAPGSFTTRPELVGSFGMVASTHWLASAAGMRLLEHGGNAFDAAVAAGLTLQVVEPHMNGPGGDLPVLFWSERLGQARVLCAQGVAPAAATIRRFEELGFDRMPGTGPLAACVPGAFDGWMVLLRDFGTAALADVMAPAIEYAERGFPLVPAVTATIAEAQDLFRAEWTTSAELYLANGVPRPLSQFRNRALAATYRRIVDEAERASTEREAQIEAARDAFYRGFVADAIVDWASSNEVLDSSGRRHAGLLTGDDLASWEAGYEAPVTFEYEGLQICKTGPWGQGPVFLQQLALLAGSDLEAMGLGSAQYLHTVLECAKLAFADREAWYGDPAFVDVPLEALLSEPYNAERRALVGDEASLELRPGAPDGRAPRVASFVAASGSAAANASAAGVGEPTLHAGDTCHVDVADHFGNLVSATPSGGWLQSSPVIPSLGFPLGTRAQMFVLDEGLPSALAPRKRPRTTLSPSLALRDGEPYMAFGTPGGDQQDQWSLHLLLAHVHFGLDLQAAIDAPAFHTTHFPSSFYPREAYPGSVHVEGRFPPRVVAELRARGHDVHVEGDWTLGRLSAVTRGPDGVLRAAANPRGMQGYAVGR
ncbi:MAG TPA: gamma-glutamyltransferase family protein [Solirubrobacteraceae bacterium]